MKKSAPATAAPLIALATHVLQTLYAESQRSIARARLDFARQATRAQRDWKRQLAAARKAR